jgi:hypothetical protein
MFPGRGDASEMLKANREVTTIDEIAGGAVAPAGAEIVTSSIENEVESIGSKKTTSMAVPVAFSLAERIDGPRFSPGGGDVSQIPYFT